MINVEGEAKPNQDRRLSFDGVTGGGGVDDAGRREGPASALPPLEPGALSMMIAMLRRRTGYLYRCVQADRESIENGEGDVMRISVSRDTK